MSGMQTIPENFLAFAATRLRQSQAEIARCLDQLGEEQMWHRGGDYENSIANLLLHLAGNMRQWVLHGIDGQPDVRLRDDEFALSPTMASSEARAIFNTTIEESALVLEALAAGRLLTVIDPQPTGTWRHMTILEAIFQVVGHVQLHKGQIIVLTKQLVQRDLDLSMPRKR
jgi:uncharacterized damage-inducible protein DinB